MKLWRVSVAARSSEVLRRRRRACEMQAKRRDRQLDRESLCNRDGDCAAAA
jgi:hypothetical protein